MVSDIFTGAWALIGKLLGFSGRKNTAVICVGMERSAKYGVCTGSGIDVSRMAPLLKKYGRTTVLQNNSATRSSVMAALKEGLKKNLCIFYYSGHGGQHKNANGENGMSEFLCLNDGPLHDYEIWEMVQKSNGRVFMIFDCCHSGTMFRSAEHGDDTSDDRFKNVGFSFKMLWKTKVRASKSLNLLVWSGCPSDELSYATANGGVFTNGILAGYGKKHTYNEVWDTAREAAKNQHPVYTKLGGGFIGRIFL